jgi:lysylphosphatidylglycerol synthetase-like protein (DUF2156 family)
MLKPSRPTGIAILAILELIGGVIVLLAGIGLAALGGSLLTALGYPVFGGLAALIGGGLAVFGLVALGVGWGLWTGKGWAWWLAVILSILGVLGSLASVAVGSPTSIVGLIVDAVILWYLFRPHVQAFFGRGVSQLAPQPAAQQPPPAAS